MQRWTQIKDRNGMGLTEAEDSKKKWQEYAEGEVKSLSHVRLFATLWTVAHQDPLVSGILQARILEWAAVSFSRGSS